MAAVGRAHALGIPPEDLPAKLTLADAERIFLDRGLDLLIAQAGAEGAEGDLRAAAAHPNPNFQLQGAVGPATARDLLAGTLDPPLSRTNGLGIGLSDNNALEDQLTGKRALRIESMSKALAAARLNVDDVRRVGLSQLRQAYAAAVMARLNVDAATESFETYDKQLVLNQRRYDEGAINGLDLSRVLQAQLEALQGVDQAQAGLRQAMASLMFLLGVRGGVPDVELADGIAFSPLASLREATVASLHSIALRNRTDVKIAAAGLEQAEVIVRQAKRSRIPDAGLSASYYEQCNSATCGQVPTITLGLQFNVPVLYQQQGEIKRAESNRLAAERNLEKAKAQVLSDVAQSWAGYVAASSQVRRMEGKLLEQARLSRDLAQHMYQKGAASLIDFMDAQRAYVASELEYHQDLASYWTAVYQLEQAVGVPLREAPAGEEERK